MRWNPLDRNRSLPCDVPASNANFAFIFDGLERVEGRAVFLLPNSVMETGNTAEISCRRYLVEHGLLSAVIALPEKMFESTSIPVCILVFDKAQRHDTILFINATAQCENETRIQRGQYGGNAHTGREYKKLIHIVQQELADEICRLVDTQEKLPAWAALVRKEELAGAEWELTPKRWINVESQPELAREFGAIVDDLNRVNEYRNTLRLFINENLAKRLGMYENAECMKQANQENEGLNQWLKKICGKELIRQDWIMLTKDKNVFKFENRHPTELSEILLLILQQYKAHLMFLNNMENRYLAELRDALLLKLMNGEIDVSDLEVGEDNGVTTA